jgi:quercetin dioxygenase-like cupin family protein
MKTLAWLCVVPLCAAWAQHPIHEAAPAEPRQVTTELENDTVQVLRIRLAPHEKIPAHDVTPRVVVYLTDEHFRFDQPDGTSVEETHKAGDVVWLPKQRHGGENLSDQPVEFIVIIPKPRTRS